MDDSNKKEFATLYYSMGEYYEKTVSTNLLLMFFSDLSKFTIEQVKEGARLHRMDAKQGSFFPKPPDIIRHIGSASFSAEDKATLAWNQIIREMRKHGAYDPLELDDKQALAAIAAVKSWKDLCAMPEKDLTWAKKEFMANYITYENTPLELLPSSLPGLVQLQEHKNDEKDAYARLQSGVSEYKAKLKHKVN